ncbi:cell division protein ZapA [Consotaella salsifontis]|uniref:Cell division protein ZapA n=1 Tax=Consotaella salsifontis TaxID=1365950 RepID=A0A1T4T4B6_9HYPH|nr:cell division protein ZapA [Consotaella salsifontis]SKA35149.1 cell division protein ZapA [Consotaella salsifontis]
MPQVVVTIDGKTYRMACAEGEEQHLEDLASDVDRRINELRASFGEIGDQRLTVMTAMTVLDELQESRRRMASLERELSEVRQTRDAARARLADADGHSASQIEAVAIAVERIAEKIEALGSARG